jgi:hypothetical protein
MQYADNESFALTKSSCVCRLVDFGSSLLIPRPHLLLVVAESQTLQSADLQTLQRQAMRAYDCIA